MWRFANRFADKARTARNRKLAKSRRVLLESLEDRRLLAIDLTVESVSLAETDLLRGSSYTLDYTVKNLGSTSLPSGTYDGIYLSSDNVFNSGDTLINYEYQYDGLGSGATDDRSLSFTVPVDLDDGPLYVLIVADAFSNVSESSESNNSDYVPVTILTPDVDLEVTDADLPADSTLYLSSVTPVTVEVTNNGSEPANSPYWNDAVYLSDNDTLDEADIRLNSVQHYNFDEPLAAGGTYSVIIEVAIETSQSLGEKFLLFVTDDLGGGGGGGASAAFVGEEGSNANSGLQAETEEGNNVLAAVRVLIAEPDVDLEVVAGEFTSPTTVDAGGSVDVQWTVENLGLQDSSSTFWWDTVYVSKDGILDELDFPFTDFLFETGPLEADATYIRDLPLTLPFGAAGTMHILVQTDRYDDQWETDESDTSNVLDIGELTIVPPNVDLQVTETTVPAGLVPNAYNPISWTITNTGNELATAYGWYDYIYLSTDDTLDSGDYAVSSQFHYNSPQLGFGEEDNYYSYNDSVYIPTDTGGAQYLLFVTDHLLFNDPYYLDNYSQPETNEDNNVTAVPVTFLSADLVVTSLAVVPTEADPDPTEADLGDTIELSYTVTNLGNYDAIPGYYGYWYDRVWISNSPTLNGSERYVTDIYHEGTLAQGDSYDVTQNVTIPNSADGQFYYLIVQTNFYSYYYYGVPEANTANNSTETELLIHSPNLTPTAFTAPPSGVLNGPIEVSWEVENNGEAAALAGWYDAVYLSNDQTLDSNDYKLFNAEYIGPPLDPTEDYSRALSLTIPHQLGAGDKFLIFKTDSGYYYSSQPNTGPGDQGETDETDNTYTALPIHLFAPDLIVTTASADDTGILSSDIHIDYTVTNWNDTDAPANYWYDYFYLSDNATYDSSDRYLGYTQINGPLAGHAHYSKGVNVFLPPEAGTGAKYLFVVSDRDDYQGETNESNNVSEPLPITISAPDLDITSATAPEQVILSGGFQVSWTVKNQGLVAAPAHWYDEIWISSDNVLDSGDTPIYANWTGYLTPAPTPLAAGDSYTVTTGTADVTIPGYLGTGNKFLIFKTDTYGYYYYYNNIGYQGETDETNNTFTLPIEVVAPDLVVTSATAPASGIVSETLNVSWTVENQGTTRAPANWYDHIYLSSNNTLSGDDLRLLDHFTGEFSPLEPGPDSAYTISSTITLPPNATSGFLLFVADGWNQQGELNENNNVLAKAISISAPDLEITTATAPTVPDVVISTGEFNVSWTVKNNGPAAAPTDWFDQIWLSDDQVIGSGDGVLLHELISTQTPLAAGAEYTISKSISIPQSYGTGTKYLIFKTDSYYNYPGDTYVVQGETDETNNTFIIPIEVVAPDLIVSSATAPDTVIANDPFNVSWTVKNQGTTPAPADWHDYVFWSANATWDSGDTPLISAFHDAPPALAAGGEYTVTRSITLNTITSGYLLFKTDHLGQQGETNETNNVWAEQIIISAPDLIVADAIAPSSAIVGQSFQVSWQVKNNSGSISAPADWSDQVYISSDNVLDGGDTAIHTEFTGGETPLASGGTYTVVRNVTIPGSTGTGSKYLIFKADASNSQAETDEANNTKAVAISVMIVAPPTFEAFQVNNGTAQRSMVTSLTVTFSSPVVIENGAFTLTKKVGSSFVNVTDVVLSFTQSEDRKKATITFSGAVDAFNSLKDGRYKLTTDDAHIRDDHNQAFTADHVDEFWRLFGDSDGDADVDNTDLLSARTAMGKSTSTYWYLNFNQDGSINSVDYTQVNNRFKKTV